MNKNKPSGVYGLGFISDQDLFNHTKETIEKYRFQINLTEFNKNLIDPVKLTFDSKVYNKSIQEVINGEVVRQLDKSNTNQIGCFHQNIFNYIGGKQWQVPEVGYDVENIDQHYFVEMKNKHNTMNSSSSQKTYIKMQDTILRNSKATCALVEVIAKNSQNSIWNISLDGEPFSNDNIRRVSIDKFYAMVTGKSTAFKDLCEVLPQVIEDVVNEIKLKDELNTVFTELKKISPNLLKSLYLLSFEKYEGFDEFNL